MLGANDQSSTDGHSYQFEGLLGAHELEFLMSVVIGAADARIAHSDPR